MLSMVLVLRIPGRKRRFHEKSYYSLGKTSTFRCFTDVYRFFGLYWETFFSGSGRIRNDTRISNDFYYSHLYRFLPIFTDFYRCLPIFRTFFLLPTFFLPSSSTECIIRQLVYRVYYSPGSLP